MSDRFKITVQAIIGAIGGYAAIEAACLFQTVHFTPKHFIISAIIGGGLSALGQKITIHLDIRANGKRLYSTDFPDDAT